jgi:hypothetical protein
MNLSRKLPPDDLLVDFGKSQPGSSNPMPAAARERYKERIRASIETQAAGARSRSQPARRRRLMLPTGASSEVPKGTNWGRGLIKVRAGVYYHGGHRTLHRADRRLGRT